MFILVIIIYFVMSLTYTAPWHGGSQICERSGYVYITMCVVRSYLIVLLLGR